MTTPITPVNLTDVALVDPNRLALALEYMVKTGRGLTMLRGITEAELREVDQALWDELGSNPVERVAVLVRFRCLIRVFAARRLANLLMQAGYRLLAPAARVAARMRLNADLGFNPIKFERALIEQLARTDTRPALAA
jgi:L-alanine-DL-glutamate epimerase-like enolase superfamily enzyme